MYRAVLLLIFTSIFIVCGSLVACGPKEVDFADSKLEAIIREAISKPQGAILTSDLNGLRSLDALRKGITDLTGLEYCTDLTSVGLAYNNISDISPLTTLTNISVDSSRSWRKWGRWTIL